MTAIVDSSVYRLPASTLFDMADLYTGVKQLFSDASLTTSVLFGIANAKEEGKGNRAVFVPRKQLGSVDAGHLRFGAFGKFFEGGTVFIWGDESQGTAADKIYKVAMSIAYNICVAMQEVSGDAVQLTSASDSEEPTRVRFGAEIELNITLAHQIKPGSGFIALPFPLVSTAIANVEGT